MNMKYICITVIAVFLNRPDVILYKSYIISDLIGHIDGREIHVIPSKIFSSQNDTKLSDIMNKYTIKCIQIILGTYLTE